MSDHTPARAPQTAEAAVEEPGREAASSADPIFAEEQAHLSQIYSDLKRMYAALEEDLATGHAGAVQDIIAMSEDVTFNTADDAEALETYAAIESLNSIIDAYNANHDANLEKFKNISLLLRQPYFAKVQLIMRPGKPPMDVYLGAAGVTDEMSRPLVVDWRSPVAETYYNQVMGPTSYKVAGRERKVELTLRRQFDISEDTLRSYFDTTVAIEDSLLLAALKRSHSEKLQAITATIQREQNAVIRHDDVPVLLVNGIAGSGKTSVLLQRIAFLLYQQRERLRPDQVWLFTPNDVFESYIDGVLPSMGESNPRTVTWRSFMEQQGAGGRDLGLATSADALRTLEEGVRALVFEDDDLRDIRCDGTILLSTKQVRSAAEAAAARCQKAGFAMGPHFTSLVTDELNARLDRALGRMAANEELQETIASMDIDEQIQEFGEMVAMDDDKDLRALARRLLNRRFADARRQITELSWLRLDRIGMRLLGSAGLNACEWLYLKMLFMFSGSDSARYVMIDEAQDYTEAQLMLLARFFAHARFMLLGDEHQAIFEHCASFDRMGEVFRRSHGEVSECRLLTSYRSSPEITELFTSLLDRDEQMTLSSVQRAGTKPRVRALPEGEAYLAAVREAVAAATAEMQEAQGTCAVIVEDDARLAWLQRQLGDTVAPLAKNRILSRAKPQLLPLRTAKGLEFDRVIIPDAQPDAYPDTPLARRRLYTALSRATNKLTVLAQGEISPLLADRVEKEA